MGLYLLDSSFSLFYVREQRLQLLQDEEIFQRTFTCSKLTMKTLEQGVKMFKVNNKDSRTTRSGVFIVNCEHISHLVLVSLLLTLNM